MAKCFITGVDMSIHDAYMLDRTAANRAVKDIRQQLAALERLIEQLGSIDDAEVFDIRKHETVIRRDRRLVTSSVAATLSAAYPKEKLFITWEEWRLRRSNTFGWMLPQKETDSQIQAGGGEQDDKSDS